MCHQRRSAGGRRRAGCPTSAPWAATDATPTGRSGPCWKPCPSHPRPASRAPRLTAPGTSVVARWPFGIVLRSIGGRVGPRSTADFLRARENPGGRMTCAVGRRELLSCGLADRPCPLLSVILRWNVPRLWAPRSRAWKALPRESAGPAPTLNGEVRADLHEPWLTACNRSYPLARARRGHGCLSGAQRSPGRRPGEDIGTGRERATTTARGRGNRAEDAEGLRHGGGPPARTERHWRHHPVQYPTKRHGSRGRRSRLPSTAPCRRCGRHGLVGGPAGPGSTDPSPCGSGGGVAPAEPLPAAKPASRHCHGPLLLGRMSRSPLDLGGASMTDPMVRR
jgi:hypothetical protein